MDFKAFWDSSRSTVISAVIALVVIAGLFVLFNALPENESDQDKDEQKQEQTKEDEEKKEGDEEDGDEVELPTKYTVERGDHLWKISNKFYKTGFNWALIAKENRLTNPDIIHAGNVLAVPKEDAKIGGRTHTVVRGDTLWDIAEKFYGSGFEWQKIAEANPGMIGTLPNGNVLIMTGQVLAVP
jgi:nucleoid-associated protein YgaU